jgi:hypothetical protein
VINISGVGKDREEERRGEKERERAGCGRIKYQNEEDYGVLMAIVTDTKLT